MSRHREISLVDAMIEAGVAAGAINIIRDGAFHRFRGPTDKPGQQNSFYAAFGEHAAVIGNWKDDIKEIWRNGHNGSRKLSQEERQKLNAQIKEAQAKAEYEQKQRHEAAESKAEKLWKLAQPISTSELQAYLSRKQISPHCARLLGTALVIPVRDFISGKLTSLQFIRPDGGKHFLKGGRIAGCYCPLADTALNKPSVLAIAEGFATASTLYEATTIPTAIAFNAGNLPAVARALRKKYPGAAIVLAADDDRETLGNPGVTKATEAAEAVRGAVAIPEFPDDIQGTDWNDLACAVGDEVVREQIAPAIEEAIAEIHRPVMSVTDAHMPTLVDHGEKVLVSRAERLRIFQRSGELVRIINLSGEEAERLRKRDGIRRERGTLTLHPITTIALMDVFERLIRFEKDTEKRGTVQAECPKRMADTYLSRVGFWRLPNLTGVIEAPLLRDDGSVLTRPGFDKATGLFLDSDEDWSIIPRNPTLDDAKTAAWVLLEPFKQFPWETDADRSVLLAAILTALQRRQLRSAPLFAFAAPAQRSGKSKLAKSVSIIATGREPAAMTFAENDQAEVRKSITSILREGLPITLLDNITEGRALDSPDLAKAITEPIYGDRLLGTNITGKYPTNILWMATGNHLSFKGDLTSRSLVCVIDSKLEHPEERQFTIEDLFKYLLNNRRALIAAALTILRAYYLADRPKQDVKRWGGFEEWSDEIREPIIWLGLADPCKTRERIEADDPVLERDGELLQQWRLWYIDQSKTIRAIAADLDTPFADGEQQEEHDKKTQPFRQAILAIAREKEAPKEINWRRLGEWCKRIQKRVIGGLRLVTDGKEHRACCWKVEEVTTTTK